MKNKYDFSSATRGSVVPLPSHQTEIRLRLDNAVLDWLRKSANEAGGGNYADNINAILQAHIDAQEDATLVRPIKEGEGSGRVSREKVFAMLQRQN